MESRTVYLQTPKGLVTLKNIYSWDASTNYIYFRGRNPWRRYFYIMKTKELIKIVPDMIPYEDQWNQSCYHHEA